MGITIHDVARHAGVSHTTVSWVVHNDKRISSKTRDKVRRSIKELNYHPNLAARSLVRGRDKTETIAIISSSFATPFEQEIMRGIEMNRDGKDNPYEIALYSTQDRSLDILNEIMYGKKADAAILLSLAISDRMLDEARSLNFPIVLIEETNPKTHHLTVNNKNGAYRAVEHLILSGRKNIGLIIEEESENWSLSQKDRLEGYKGALENFKIEFSQSNIEYIKHYYFEEGVVALRKLLKRNPGIDAIFCAAGDMVAMGALRETKLENIRIPEDLVIIGFDDIQASSLVQPSLTTMRVPLDQMGSAAYEITVQAAINPDIPVESICYTSELIIRDSG